ncbi:MAG: T9SS type A sorting domain-containing protein [Bacteroidetes bacterium]|nr:T9SS type A sorting domain-containing protein [Bacteroidota bacterium]
MPALSPSHISFKADLPDQINNATQPYFRPLYPQESIECGQYSGIAFNFCYEINYQRNLPANVPENQYPTHYTFNFMNGGWGWQGVSYHHSLEIARANGHPNIIDYGGNYENGPSMWMSGYEKYYHGMFNKVDNIYQIPVGTPEGLLVLKNWLHNHLDGSDVGGIASFYSSSPWNPVTLPPGTPEGGKHVITGFVGPVGHAATITGYNDSIRFDYNQDGLFTNDIDINDDGIVDMRDWEIGGLLFTDSYINGLNWADSGFCYMMYKTLAERPENGGIWNHVVHVVKVQEDYAPLITMKAKVRHTCRNRIKISAGVASDPDAVYPEKILNFPIFNYQGGCQYMQGGWGGDSISLELGLDITPLLSYIESGEMSRFFLLINEDDPDGWGSGELEFFSLIDYTNGQINYSDTQNYGPLVQNGLTLASVNATIDFNELDISTPNIPAALTGEPYEYQLEAQGGKPLYQWDLIRHYGQTHETFDFPTINGEALQFEDTIHATIPQKLDFDFPFYGKSYDSVYIHTDGFLMFDSQQYPWPYMHDEELMIRKSSSIAPFLNVYLYIKESAGNGIWYEGDETKAAFRWHMSSDKLQSNDVEFAVFLYPSGEIEFYYGAQELFVDHNWGAGISMGDDLNYALATISNQQKLPVNKKIKFNPSPLPNGMSLSEDGTLSITPAINYNGIPVQVQVKDKNNLIKRKTYDFYSWYAGVDEQIKKDAESLTVYPNPTSGSFHLELNLTNPAILTFELITARGQTISSYAAQSHPGGLVAIDFTIPSDQQDGIYYLVMKSQNFIKYNKIVLIR